MQDLNGEHIIMPVKGVSEEMDAFRAHILSEHPTVQIVDSKYCGIDTFALCEVERYILITHPIYADIHTDLITIPLENDFDLPYGLIYSNEPTLAARKLLEAVRVIKEL